MTTVSQPNVTINILSAREPVKNNPQKILIIGRKAETAAATGGGLYRNVNTAKDAASLFGAASELATMIDVARSVNSITPIDVLCFDQDASGSVASTNTITVSSASGAEAFSEAGSFSIIIGSRYKSEDVGFVFNYNAGATPEEIASQIVSQITADKPDDFPVALSSTDEVVTTTSVNVGSDSASIPIIVHGKSDADLVITIGTPTSAEESGLPAGWFDPIANDRYQTIIASSVATYQDLTAFLEPRFNIKNRLLDGVAIRAKADTSANFINTISALNSRCLAVFADKMVSRSDYSGGTYGEINYIIAAQIGAIRALRLTEGADISRYVVASAALDATGGPAIASLPYFNTPLPLLLPTKDLSSGFSDIEVSNLTNAGVSIFGNNIANNAVILSATMTTYKTDAAGNKDDSFKYLNYVDTSCAAREYMFNNARRDFDQSRLTSSGGLVRGRTINNDESVGGDFCGYYKELSLPEYTLTQASAQAQAVFKTNLITSVDMETGMVTVSGKLPIVTQLRSIITSFNLAFNI